MLPQLPAGLSPVDAGRYGLWLLAQRSHRLAKRRSISATSVRGGSTVTSRFIRLMLPWSIYQYPGWMRGTAELVGVSKSTVKKWLYMADRLPKKHAARFADICAERAAAFAALEKEFRAVAEGKPVREQGF